MNDKTRDGVSGLLWRWVIAFVIVIVAVIGATWRLNSAANRLERMPATEGMDHKDHTMAPAGKTMWYRCTMPECGDVGSAQKGSRCPVCGMVREPVGYVDNESTDVNITLSPRAQRLAAIATEPVAYRYLMKEIRTVGRIAYDETRYKVVSAWSDGRIDELFADFTGMVVKQGDHLVELYSPDLYAAQEEYLQTLRSAKALRAGTTKTQQAAEQLLKSAKTKLLLLGVTEQQIALLEKTGTPQTHLVIYAPIAGTIVNKRASEGNYVKTGDVLYEIADLTNVWLLLDVYEADLPWIMPFQHVTVTTEAQPGVTHEGTIAFVDPVVNAMTRTIQVRVNVSNPDGKLKPEMFAVAQMHAMMSTAGTIAPPKPSGKYACPMHPWETSIQSDSCPVCQMDMVAIESIPGFVPAAEVGKILSVPRSAVLSTGQRTQVYVEVEDGTYEGVKVRLGPLAQSHDGDEYFPVLEGLAEGQLIVTRGAFAIDSEAQITGKPSLLAPVGTSRKMSEQGAGHQHH